MANPYEVQVPNVLQALMAGEQGYKDVSGAIREQRTNAVREQAAQSIMQGGNPQNALAQLLSVGDDKGAATLAAVIHNQTQTAFQQQQLAQQAQQFGVSSAESARHNRAGESVARDTLEAGKVQVIPGDFGQPSRIVRVGPHGIVELPLQQQPGPQGSPAPQPAPQPQTGQVPPQTVPNQDIVTATMQKYGGKPGDGKDWAYLSTLPENAQIKIIGLTQHNINPSSLPARQIPGTGDSIRSQATTAASRFDNTYNQQDYPLIQANRQRFDTGTQGNNIRSLNVVVDHAATLRDLGLALKNGNIQLFNSIAQRWAQETGNPAPTNLNLAKQIVGSELVKALGVAGAGTEGERAELGKGISNASSPDQIIGAIDNVARPLLAGQLRGLRQQFTSSTRQSEDKFNQMLFPNTLKFLNGEQKGGAAQPSAPPVKWRVIQ